MNMIVPCKANDKYEITLLHKDIYIFSNGSTAPWGPRPPHFSRLHDHTFLDTPHSVGLLWTRDQIVAEKKDIIRILNSVIFSG
jgi:hypothetical protein